MSYEIKLLAKDDEFLKLAGNSTNHMEILSP